MAAVIRIVIDSARARSGAKEASRAIDKIGMSARRTSGLTQSLSYRLRRLGASAAFTTAGITPLVAAFGGLFGLKRAVDSIGAFEEQIAALQGVLEVPNQLDANFQALIQTAKDLGATTRFTATETATALTRLSRAGLDLEETISAIKPALDLASASQLELEQSTSVMVDTLRQWDLNAMDAAHAANVLTKTSISATLEVQDLYQAMTFAAGVSKTAGLSFEQTAAAIGVLADRGLRGTRGGTALRRILQLLVDPTDEAREIMSDLGLTMDKVNLQTNNLADVFKLIGERIGKVEQPATALFEIFKVRGAAGAAALAETFEKLSDLFQKNIEVGDIAARNAKLIEDTLPGAFRRLTAAAEGAQIALGDTGLGQALKEVVDTGANVIRILFGIADKTALADERTRDVLKVLRSIVEVLSVLITIKAAFFFASLINPINLAIAAIAALIVKLEILKPLLDSFDPKFAAYDAALTSLFRATGKAASATRDFANAYKQNDLAGQVSSTQQQIASLEESLSTLALMAGLPRKGLDAPGIPSKFITNILDAVGGFENLRKEIKETEDVIDVFTSNVDTGTAIGLKYNDAQKILVQVLNALKDRYAAMNEELRKATEEAGNGADTDDDATDAKIRLSNALDDYIHGLREEVQLSRLTADEQEVLQNVTEAIAAARRAAVPITAQTIRQIIHMTRVIQENTAALDHRHKALDLEQDTLNNQYRLVLDYGMALQREIDLLTADNLEREKRALILDLEAAGINKNTIVAQELIAKLEELHRLREIQDLAEDMGQAFTDAFGAFITGTLSAKEAMNQLFLQISNAVIQAAVLKPLMESISGSTGGAGGGGSGIAGLLGAILGAGGVVSRGGPIPYQRGTIFGGPTLSPMAGGRTALLGERGPEGALPLARLPSGELGVKTDGGGGAGPTTNVFHVTYAGRAPENRRSRRQMREGIQEAVLSAQAKKGS